MDGSRILRVIICDQLKIEKILRAKTKLSYKIITPLIFSNPNRVYVQPRLSNLNYSLQKIWDRILQINIASKVRII